MPPKLALTIAGTLLVAAAAAGITIPNMAGVDGSAKRAPRADLSRPTDGASAPPQRPDAGGETQHASPSATVRPRAGRVYDLEDAIKRLDLIKPARNKMAEDFTLPTPTSATFKLSEHRGKVVLINFWATWCPPCLQEMPAMERLYRQHKGAGFEMVAVSVDTEAAKVKPFLAEHRFTFHVAMDPTMALANTYGVRALPSSFIVDRKGALAALAIGPRHWDNDASHSLVEAMVR
jgi:peroxiredoxin